MTAPNRPYKPFHIAVCVQEEELGAFAWQLVCYAKTYPALSMKAQPAFAEIGTGVSFGPNAVRAMSCIDPKIEEGYKRQATANRFPEKRRTWFDFRIGMREDGWKGMKAPGKEGQTIAHVLAGTLGQSSVHRAHFLDELVQLVPDGMAKFGKRVVKVEKQGQKMQLAFNDGSRSEADAVIGCDGVKSRTRQILLGENHEAANPIFTGKFVYRGLIPMAKAVAAIGEELARNSQMYLGEHGHLLTFPIENGRTMNVVAFRTKENGKWEDERWVLPTSKEDMCNNFEGWGENVQKILSLMEKPDIWALFDHPPALTYYKGNFALLGDAGHASTPHQGAGAGQAIEDAFVLSNLLGDVDSIQDIERAFYAYDTVRRPRSQKVVSTSREAVSIYEFESEQLGSDLDLIRKTLETRYDWIWNENLYEQLKRAQDIMGLMKSV